MISRLPGSRCLEVSGCSLRRKAGGRVAHDETRDVDRRRAATGLDRARVRAQRSCLALHSAITWLGALRGWRHARASGMALGMGARDDHARQRSGSGRRIPLRARGASSWGEAEGHEHSPAGSFWILVTRRTAAGGNLARSRLLEINFPTSPLGERRPGFSLEKNGFTRVKVVTRRTAGAPPLCFRPFLANMFVDGAGGWPRARLMNSLTRILRTLP